MALIKQLLIIFLHFLLLGCVSFGGPAAHIGYFKSTFVDKLQWLKNDEYANLISLSQILPGPGSSQIGFAIGLHKAGLWGGVAAFIGFTLPSFILMYSLASITDFSQSKPWLVGLIYGLKLLAVVVVLDAVISMFKSFCKTKVAISIALSSAALLMLVSSPLWQIFVILSSAAIGVLTSRTTEKSVPFKFDSNKFSYWPLLVFLVLFALSLVSWSASYANMLAPFIQSGSLVFGGGHVVLPLLQASLGDSISQDAFVFGYAAAQGVPGPMFTIATYIGGIMNPAVPLTGALLATLAIFLPGFLLVLALRNVWQTLLANCYFLAATRGINAAVVGLLIAAFYNPILTSAITDLFDLVWVIAGFLILKIFKPHICILIVIFITLGLISVNV
ncbi:chromate efflux transporter [Paraglaciecola sp. L3A3]|uniref:chromate efflux transporter n=1 Tax=Paraglaciecola sp. L3A3 TaxID=2686358 RepID=UPI00131BB562|nr:chromate efflux transporter [Paraglaciecola sp. L3A3]